MRNRRSFIQKATLLSGWPLLGSFISKDTTVSLNEVIARYSHIPTDQITPNEDFWYQVQQAFTVSGTIINLNNGGVSPAPKTVQDAMKRYYDLSNEAPSYFMWRVLDMGREPLREELAAIAGCLPEEIAINRNASEGLETIIFGLQLKAGDEVVLCKQDYPNMINAWKQREKREGIRLKWVELQLPSEDENYLATQYTNAFSPATKVVHITHIINWNGQVLPVKKIAEAAHHKGIEVVVDGAHSFAHINFSIPELNADYFATSLHKWLYAPIGSGLLYVKKSKIKNLYPLLGTEGDPLKDDIRKFESLGTRPFFIEQAIAKAIEFHQLLGPERKFARLHYLKQYWTAKTGALPGVIINTPASPEWSGAIGNFAIKNKKPADIDNHLFSKYKIHTVAIDWPGISGVRVTPNVYTTTRQLDKLVNAIATFITIP